MSRDTEKEKVNDPLSPPPQPHDVCCVVCANDIVHYAIASCTPAHPICSKCITRMRYLKKDNRCPVCRTDLTWVLFASKVVEWNQSSIDDQDPIDRKSLLEKFFNIDEMYRIIFQSKENYDEFLELTTIKCQVCGKVIRTEDELKTHLRKIHELKLCELCLINLNRFPNEYVYYDRAQLALHNKSGDKLTMGLNGHPLCEFCSKRYLDSDDLEIHQRREHFYCHFCSDQGFVEFFAEPSHLKKHYKTYHFLCEEGECALEFGFFSSVFNNEMDLQAHRLQEHGKSYSKKTRDQLKQIPFHFETPYSRNNNNNESSSSRVNNNNNNSNLRSVASAPSFSSYHSRRHNQESSNEPGTDGYQGATGGYNNFDVRGGYQTRNRNNQSQSQNNRPPTYNTRSSNRFGRDRNLNENSYGDQNRDAFGSSSHNRNGASTAFSSYPPPGIDFNIAPSERGFFEIKPKTPQSNSSSHHSNNSHSKVRSEGLPLSEQHKLTTTIANSGVVANNNADSSSGANLASTQSLADFPDLPVGSSAQPPNFWSGFNANSMTGTDHINFPSLPPATEAPAGKRSAKSKKLQKAAPVGGSVWGTSNSADSTGEHHGVERNHSQSRVDGSHLSNVVSSQQMSSMFHNSNVTNSPLPQPHHPNYLVVRPKTKKAKKGKKNKNDSDQSLAAIKNIFLEVERDNNKSNDDETNQEENGWKSFESNEMVMQSSKVMMPQSDVNDSELKSFQGLTLRDAVIEEKLDMGYQNKAANGSRSRHNPREEDGADTQLLDAPPGFGPEPSSTSHLSNELCASKGMNDSSSMKNGVEKKERTSKTYHYLEPEDFDVRNKKLNAMIHQLLTNKTTGDEKLYHDFMRMSRSFTSGQGSANAVLNFSKYNFGDNFNLVFTEILCLLPDISSQKKLYNAFIKQKLTGSEKMLEENITTCSICSQILAHRDKKWHMKQQHEDEEEPTLDVTSPENRPIKSFENDGRSFNNENNINRNYHFRTKRFDQN